MAIIGGTFARLGGGKFANGALSGAFVHLFNDEYESLYYRGKGVPRALGGEGGITDKQAQTNDKIALASAGEVGVVSGTGILVIKYGAKGAAYIIFTAIVEITSVANEGKLQRFNRTSREQQILKEIEENAIRQNNKTKKFGKD